MISSKENSTIATEIESETKTKTEIKTENLDETEKQVKINNEYFTIRPFSKDYYRKDEIGKIDFSISNLKEVIRVLDSCSYKKLYEKKKLTVLQCPSSFINHEFLLGKMIYIIYKNELSPKVTLKILYESMFDTKIRSSWDKGLEKVCVVKEISTNPKSYICHTWCKSPIFLISEREFVEKRIEHHEENVSYMFSTSVPDETIDKTKATRCINFFNFQIIEEVNDKFIFTSYGQTDLKMIIPETLLNVTIPSKFRGWFEEFHKYINKTYK